MPFVSEMQRHATPLLGRVRSLALLPADLPAGRVLVACVTPPFFSFVEATARFLGSCEKLWPVSLSLELDCQ